MFPYPAAMPPWHHPIPSACESVYSPITMSSGTTAARTDYILFSTEQHWGEASDMLDITLPTSCCFNPMKSPKQLF